MPEDMVARLYGLLVEELRARGHPLERPVKVAELYEELVPYRRVRSPLGLELNADYEHALLRLLAGEGDLVRVEPPETRDELRAEAAAAYPSVGLFRKFPDAEVSIVAPEAASSAPETASSAPAPRDRTPGETPGETPRETPAAETEPAGAAMTGNPGAPPPAGDPGAGCVFCGERLPTGQRVRFCPYCGGDQRLRPCPRCAAVVEREWRFCIGCGQEVPAP